MAVTAPGSPYVETSDLVANYPGVSESLAERVDLVGVLPFADSAARTTALPSPTDGQYSYLQDTNATEYYNGSAWVAAGVAPGLVHINTTAFSAVSSVSLDNVFTSDYDNYRIMMSALASSSGDCNMRLRSGGTDATSGNYFRQLLDVYSTSVVSNSFSSETSWDNVFRMTTPTPGNLSMDLFDPNKTAHTTFTSLNGQFLTAPRQQFVSGGHTLSTAYDGITFSIDSGTITGTLRIYGYKNGA